MESLADNTTLDQEVNQPFLNKFNAFMGSSQVLQLLTTDSSLLQEYTLQALINENSQVATSLIIKGHAEFSAERLLAHLCNHWKLLTPVNTSGFRVGLDDFLNCYRKQIKQGLLIVTEVDQLPLATQAALMHLVYLQEEKGLALKVLLFTNAVARKKLNLFRPDGMSEICLQRDSKVFTRWLVQKIVREHYAKHEKMPADIVELAHNFSHGNPEEIRWIIDKWFSAADSAHKERKTPVVADSLEAPVAISKIKSSFWNKHSLMSGLMMLAVSIGLVTHGLNDTKHSHHFSSWHASEQPQYDIRVLDTTNRMEALQWIAHHPGLADEHVVSDRDRAGTTHYHVAFGKFTSQKEADKMLNAIKVDPQFAGARVNQWTHT